MKFPNLLVLLKAICFKKNKRFKTHKTHHRKIIIWIAAFISFLTLFNLVIIIKGNSGITIDFLKIIILEIIE